MMSDVELTKAEERGLKQMAKEYEKRPADIHPDIQEFINTKLSSKWWRMNNLYWIRNKDGELVKLKLNPAQTKTLRDFKHHKKIILKSRQHGISTLYAAYNLDLCLFRSGQSAGIQSYGLDESQKLQEKVELMWEHLDPSVKELMGLSMVMNNQKGMAFSNGSILKIGNFRGDTLQSLHVSELAKISLRFPDKAKELKTGAFQAVSQRNRITIESTAEGKSGLFWEMWNKADQHQKRELPLGPFDFQPVFLSWMEDVDCYLDQKPHKDASFVEDVEKYLDGIEKHWDIKLTREQRWWYIAKKDELGHDMVQEYPSTPEEAFQVSSEGTYYKEEYKNLKIRKNTYDPNLLVHSAMDLGMNDTFAIGFFQVHPPRNDLPPRIRMIGEMMDSGQGLMYYREAFDALSKKYGWVHGKTYVPHDAKVRELIAAKTRFNAMKEMGWDPILVKKHRLMDGIEQTRTFLRDLVVDSSCEHTIAAIHSYRKKYNRQYDVYLDSPVDDEHTHPADMVRYFAMGFKYNEIKDYFAGSKSNSKPSNLPRAIKGFEV